MEQRKKMALTLHPGLLWYAIHTHTCPIYTHVYEICIRETLELHQHVHVQYLMYLDVAPSFTSFTNSCHIDVELSTGDGSFVCYREVAFFRRQKCIIILPLRWNPSNPDTTWPEKVSLFQDTNMVKKVSCLERCPHFRGVLGFTVYTPFS